MITVHTSNKIQKIFVLTKTLTTLERLGMYSKIDRKKNFETYKNKDSFDNAKHIYQNALSKSNFSYNLEYNSTNDNIKPKNRKKNCIFYSPPFCESERKIWKSTLKNSGQTFLKIN